MEILHAPFWLDVENWPISWAIGGTAWFPFLESIYVLTATFVVGPILIVDLRLLRFTAPPSSITRLSK